MKNRSLILAMLAALLASFIPLGAQAGKPTPLTLHIRNQTGAPATMRLSGSAGDVHHISLPTGLSAVQLPDGFYQYYAATQCGAYAGSWNLNVAKTLHLGCDLPYLLVGVSRDGAKAATPASCFHIETIHGIWNAPSENWQPTSLIAYEDAYDYLLENWANYGGIFTSAPVQGCDGNYSIFTDLTPVG